MENTSQSTSFILAAYIEVGPIKYIYFTILFLLYVAVVISNILLIGVISSDRQLHKPMYFFMCNLALNGLYGSTGLIPCLLVNILSVNHDISEPACLIQIFCLHTYGTCEFTNLAVMSYDRYLSVCHPLQYHRIMSPLKINAFIAFAWLFPFCKTTVTVILSFSLPRCGRRIEKVYCDNFSVVNLACRNTTVNNIYGLVSLFLSVGPQLSLITYSYLRILKISLKASKKSRAKALNTCTPHFIGLANFSIAAVFEVLQSRFDMGKVPQFIRVIISVYFIIVTPCLNPVIYGIRSREIRNRLEKVLRWRAPTHLLLVKKHIHCTEVCAKSSLQENQQ